MRICLAAPYFQPELGAASLRAASLVEAFEAAGHQVTVVTPKPSYFLPGRRTGSRDTTLRLPSRTRIIHAAVPLRRGEEPTAMRLVVELLASLGAFPVLLGEARKADVVYASSPPLLYSLAALLAGKLTRTPSALEIRDMWPEIVIAALPPERRDSLLVRTLSRIGSILSAVVCSMAGLIVTVTKADSEALRKKGVEPAKILFSPNGADEISLALGRRRESMPGGVSGALRIAYAGRLGPAQGVTALLDAASLVEDHLEITIVGDGPDAPALREKARALRRHRVEILGPMPREKVLELLLQSDAVYVSLASADIRSSVPSKLYEALALGVPVILAGSGDCREVLESCGAGVVAEPGVPSSIAEAIESLAADREAVRRAGLAGRRSIAETYRRRDIMGELARKLEEFLARTATCTD